MIRSRRKNTKPCKGYKTTESYGCNKPIDIHTSGLCDTCLNKWKIDQIKQGNTSVLSSITRKAKIEVNKAVKTKRNEVISEKKKKPVSANFNIYTTTAWKWCSHYVLLYYADDSGFVRCSTSPNLIYHVTDPNLHCGHFIKTMDGTKSHYSVAFDFRNLAPQSASDNVRYSGKPEVMEKWLRTIHGPEEMEKLHILKHRICKLTKYDLELIAKHYKSLFDELLKNRNINNPWK